MRILSCWNAPRLVAVRGSVPRGSVMPSSVVSADEMFEGGPTAMTLVEPQPQACSARCCSAHFVSVSRIPAEPGNFITVGVARRLVVERDSPRRKRTVTLGWVGAQIAHKKGCGQCPHLGLWIRLYRLRTEPDWGDFRGRGGFSGGAAGSSPTSGTCFPCSEAF